MSYSYYKFLRPITTSDKSIKVLDDNNDIKYTINPFVITNVSVDNNLLRINLKSLKVIIIGFSTKNEAKLALIRLQQQIDTLTNNVPILIDKDIQNYVQDLFAQVSTGPQGEIGPTGPQGEIGPTGPQGEIGPETGIYYFNDFLGPFTTYTNDGNISSDGNFGQTTTALNSDTNKQGFANVNTTTASAGAGNIYIGHSTTANSNFILGGGVTIYETLIWLPNLSTSGERFSCLIGFSSGDLNQNNSANNIAFLYDEGNIAFAGAGGASANWRAVTIDSATRTFTNTGIAVNAGAFIKLKIVVNANASSVGFFIDNTLVATHTTNIPSGNSKGLSVRNYIQKSVGYTQRQLILDYVKLQQTFTTAR